MARSTALARHKGKGTRGPSRIQTGRKKEGKAQELVSKRQEQLRRQASFLKGYIKAGTITEGAAAAKVSRQVHYDWLEKDEEYSRAFEAAKETCTEGLEAECRRRALKRSDILLIFLLKSQRPNVYRDRWEGKLDTTSIVAPMTPAMLKHMSSGELEQARVLFRKMLGQGEGGSEPQGNETGVPRALPVLGRIAVSVVMLALLALPVPVMAAQMEPAVVLDQLRELDPALASALKQALQPSPPARGPRSPALVQLGLLAVLGGVAVASSQGRVGLAAMGAGVVCIVVGGMEVQANPSIVTVRVRW